MVGGGGIPFYLVKLCVNLGITLTRKAKDCEDNGGCLLKTQNRI